MEDKLLKFGMVMDRVLILSRQLCRESETSDSRSYQASAAFFAVWYPVSLPVSAAVAARQVAACSERGVRKRVGCCVLPRASGSRCGLVMMFCPGLRLWVVGVGTERFIKSESGVDSPG